MYPSTTMDSLANMPADVESIISATPRVDRKGRLTEELRSKTRWVGGATRGNSGLYRVRLPVCRPASGWTVFCFRPSARKYSIPRANVYRHGPSQTAAVYCAVLRTTIFTPVRCARVINCTNPVDRCLGSEIVVVVVVECRTCRANAAVCTRTDTFRHTAEPVDRLPQRCDGTTVRRTQETGNRRAGLTPLSRRISNQWNRLGRRRRRPPPLAPNRPTCVPSNNINIAHGDRGARLPKSLGISKTYI